MDLLEYQAKELFREIGIPVLPSQGINRPADLKSLQIPYPVVLKSQVPTGGRGRAGGIRFVENTIDAIAAARVIFSLSILGKYPQVLLAESRYDADQEFYLAVILDYTIGRPVLLGSTRGGIGIEVLIEDLQKVVVEENFSPFYARRLAVQMGLQGNLIESVSGIVQKMYQLFVQKDLDLVEINPLGISATGEVMALDGKITVNNNALGRHPELATLLSTTVNGNLEPQLPKSKLTETEGNIGILCNSSCLAATTLDLLYQKQGKPASCLIVEEDAIGNLHSAFSGEEQLKIALEKLTQAQGIKVILVNILSSAAKSKQVAEVIANYLLAQLEETPVLSVANRREIAAGVASSSRQQRTPLNTTAKQELASVKRRFSKSSLPQFVIRLVGGAIDSSQELLAGMPVYWMDNLDQAVGQAVSLAQSTVKKSRQKKG
ncbi:MAG: succinate--CoA ligase subunit beta [Symploca sp. SIO1A3]|nr:succinate--CoA ligase subunit beta [Symploca sp. SIO2C1]NER50440.1 succinate--CoA ligase subunit beta [Symploca sp. SIO1A3]